MLYTINACAFNDVQKVFNRYAKKANAIGLECSLKVVKTYVKEVTVWAIDEVTHTEYKAGTTAIDVMDIDLVYPEYKLGNYRVAAVIEHGDDNMNVVYPYDNFEVPKKYYTGRGVCEHCGTKHNRIKTILLEDNVTNELKQVGRNCLKEYTGVTDVTLINAYIALDNILAKNDSDFGIYGMPESRYTDTFEYLAKCVHLCNKEGYVKEKTKYDADKVKSEDITEVDITTAQAVIDFFTNIEDDILDNFLHNIKVAVTNTYCKPFNGFVAYAYTAYQKEVARLEELAKKNKELANITYYGNVGDKIKNIQVTGRCCAGYETIYGYTYIYKFQDNNGHVFTWKTTVDIDRDDNGIFTGTISGTIKAHEEYAGERQTVLTRCKTA